MTYVQRAGESLLAILPPPNPMGGMGGLLGNMMSMLAGAGGGPPGIGQGP
jgi:hypothetical protein